MSDATTSCPACGFMLAAHTENDTRHCLSRVAVEAKRDDRYSDDPRVDYAHAVGFRDGYRAALERPR